VTETEIIAGCLKKNVVCQYALFHRHARQLMSVCLRYAGDAAEAEDMLQESFIRIFTSLHQYRFQGSFEGWLRKITVHTCLRKLQQHKIRFDEIKVLETASDSLNPDAVSVLSEKELIRLISELPEGYRVVFNLSVLEGFSHDEIAAMLGIEPATSRSQLIKARRLLQKQIALHQKIALQHERRKI
jgi:RNA polymerase sigma factor (sigma-70 family)